MPYRPDIPAHCDMCRKPFLATSRGRDKRTRFCSTACVAAHQERPAAVRFWEKVEKTETCWLWTGATDHFGYGVFRHERRAQRAHRVAWELLVGPIPEGMQVCHKCDNPPCVRAPEHFFLSSNAGNVADMVAKGRSCIGERQGASKLTAAKVLEIRARYAAGERPKVLGPAYGVHPEHIYRVVRGDEWKHV